MLVIVRTSGGDRSANSGENLWLPLLGVKAEYIQVPNQYGECHYGNTGMISDI